MHKIYIRYALCMYTSCMHIAYAYRFYALGMHKTGLLTIIYVLDHEIRGIASSEFFVGSAVVCRLPQTGCVGRGVLWSRGGAPLAPSFRRRCSQCMVVVVIIVEFLPSTAAPCRSRWRSIDWRATGQPDLEPAPLITWLISADHVPDRTTRQISVHRGMLTACMLVRMCLLCCRSADWC